MLLSITSKDLLGNAFKYNIERQTTLFGKTISLLLLFQLFDSIQSINKNLSRINNTISHRKVTFWQRTLTNKLKTNFCFGRREGDPLSDDEDPGMCNAWRICRSYRIRESAHPIIFILSALF